MSAYKAANVLTGHTISDLDKYYSVVIGLVFILHL